jgi:hypothetical protein
MITLIQMAGGIYDSQNFEEILLKMASSKKIVSLIYSSQNILEYIL